MTLDDMDLPLFMTDEEVGSILHRSPRQVRVLRWTGKLAFLPGKPPVVSRASLKKYLAASIVEGPKRRPRHRRKISP